jgi:hypothetical protein
MLAELGHSKIFGIFDKKPATSIAGTIVFFLDIILYLNCIFS